MALNHYAINQIIGGTMIVGHRPRFGRFGLSGAVGQMLANRPRPGVKVKFDLEADRAVATGFAKIANGASAETVLIDRSLAKRFQTAARKLGAHAGPADLNRRLLNIRKNPARYRKHGIELPPATKIVPHPSIVPQFAHVIEFALVRLRSRYGVSIDDILIDEQLGDQYEDMVKMVAPALDSQEMRLAALYIRKTRSIEETKRAAIEALDADLIERAFTGAQTIASIDPSSIPTGEGLVEILDNHQHLYISRSEDLQGAVRQIASEKSLRFMANDFWQPDPNRLGIRIYTGDQYQKVKVSQWQLKLIQDKRPVFNWPIAA